MTAPVRDLRVTAAVASSQLGGTERVLLDLAEHADELKIDLKVVVPTEGPLVPALESRSVPTRVVSPPPRLLRGSQQRGHLWSLLGAASGLLAWSRDLSTDPYLREADIAYTVGFKTHMAVGLTRTRPLVWHLHEFPPETTGSVWRFLARQIPDAVVTNSVSVHRAWTEGSTAGNAHVVTNGVDLERFRPRSRTLWLHEALGLPHDRRLIGMPAVLAEWKGQLQVIEAFKRLGERFSNVHLVLVGGAIYDTAGSERFEEKLNEIVKHDSSSRIHLVPFHEEVETVYPELDVTMHYSLRPEPFGRVVLESLACGVPVIAAAEGGPTEILGPLDRLTPPITNAPQGWLVTPRDPTILAQALHEALEAPRETLVELGRAGRQRAEGSFSGREFARRLSDVFYQVSGGSA